MKINTIPVWNGLINHNYTYIVSLIKEYSEGSSLLQEWLALYDIDKRKTFLDKDFPDGHWRRKRNKLKHSFLYTEKAKYVILEFTSTKVTRKYDNEYPLLLKRKVTFFHDLEKVLTFVEGKEILLDSFYPPHFENYPLNIRTWDD